jgi:hypothetical protein
MEDMQHEVARLREAGKQLAGEHLNGDDLALPDAVAESLGAPVRMVTDMVKALAIHMDALWEAVDLLAANASR